MEEKENANTGACDFRNVEPLMLKLPYPAIQVREENIKYANLLSMDYCGSVSELSAITQYINNENRLSSQNCPIAKTILGIAIAEMIHLQKIGQMIVLLGGSIDFVAKHRDGKQEMWSPDCLTIPEKVNEMIAADIESEKAAISQYRMHMRMIHDHNVNAVLARIIKDEEYHIKLLLDLRKEL